MITGIIPCLQALAAAGIFGAVLGIFIVELVGAAFTKGKPGVQ